LSSPLAVVALLCVVRIRCKPNICPRRFGATSNCDFSFVIFLISGRILEGGEKPLYVARRLIRAASEDIGLADPNALLQATTAFQACHMLGMPECDVVLAQVNGLTIRQTSH
jgi:hypothetical protein